MTYLRSLQIPFSFADDSTLHGCLPPGPLAAARKQLADSLNSDLEKIDTWGKEWLVTFNASKTTQLIVSRRRYTNHPAVSFQNTNLPSSSEMKLLGVTISSKVSLEDHLQSKLRAASRMIGVLYRLQNVLPLSSMLQLYKSLIRPHLEYCSNLLDSASKKSIELMEKLQRRAMRILGCTEPVKENILPLSHRREVGALSLLYRYFHGRCSKEILKLVPTLQHFDSSTSRSASKHPLSLAIPRSRTSQHQKSFFPRSVRSWNSLPPSVFPIEYDLAQFKRNVNRHLKSQYQ